MIAPHYRVAIEGRAAPCSVFSFRNEEALSTPYRFVVDVANKDWTGANADLRATAGGDPHETRYADLLRPETGMNA